MADLTSGGYAEARPLSSLLGMTSNAQLAGGPARSNLEWFGLGNASDGALAATGVACSVAVPVDVGQVISKASIFIGATAEATGTHAWAALYSGIAAPALMAQSADNTGAAAAAASARMDFTLATAQLITPATAPNGFVYVSIAFTAGTIPTALCVATPTAIGYQWFATGPLFLSATHGAAVVGVAPATIVTPAAKAVAPVVVLT